jgi:ribulose-phosphate 3-epimerase
MTVNPGFAGQRFIPEAVTKIRAARHVLGRDGLAVELEADGGIGESTAGLAGGAGASVLVAGSAVFAGDGRVAERIAAQRRAAAG